LFVASAEDARRSKARARRNRGGLTRRGDLEKLVSCAAQHFRGLDSVEITFPRSDDDGGGAVTDEVAERARHSDKPVDRNDKDEADGWDRRNGVQRRRQK
jgi:hypothetical protein